MTTIIENISTPLPTKTNEMSWEDFYEAITDAEHTEKVRLLEVIPTPPMTAEPRSDAWNEEWFAQRRASDKRDAAFYGYCSKLILEIGKALASAVPAFRSLDIEYEGMGDSGEACVITIYTDRPRMFDAEGNFRRPTHEENEAFNQQQDAANNILPSDLKEWMDETAWMIAYNRHPGFEIDAGGFGQIVVARADEDDASSPLKLTIRHTERVEQSYDDEVLA